MFKNVIRGLFVIFVGVAFLVWPSSAVEVILKMFGVMLAIFGVATLVHTISAGQISQISGNKIISIIAAAMFLVIGGLIFFKTSSFVKIIAYLFGVILIIYGIVQIVYTYRFAKNGVKKPTLYIVPVVITIIGVLFFFGVLQPEKILIIIFGIALILLGLSELFIDREVVRVKKILKQNAERGAQNIDKSTNVEDIPESDIEYVEDEV